MADVVGPVRGEQVPPRPRAPHEAAPGRTYRSRFVIGYAVLAALLAAAGVGTYLVTRGDHTTAATAQTWSTWRPRFSGELGAIEIARHVGHEYRLPSGEELVGVIASRPHVTTPDGAVRVEVLFVNPEDKQYPNDTNAALMGNAITYTLCGTGQGCAISEGEPSLERAALLRREALELALYTFHYDASVQRVLAIMPPRAGQAATFMLVFSRPDLSEQTGLPLQTTLPARPRQTVGDFPQDEQRRIDSLVGPSLYQFRLQQAGDGNFLYVLNPFQL